MSMDYIRNELDGMQRTDDVSKDLIRSMAQSGVVAAFCPDTRKVAIIGAVSDEFRISRGFVVTPDGVVPSEADDDDRFFRCVRDADLKEYGPVPLSFETNADHEPFSVLEGDSLFCVGVIFSLTDKTGPVIWEGSE